MSAVTLRWAAPAGASVTGYQIRWYRTGTKAPSWTVATRVAASTLEHIAAGLRNGASYTFDVRAVNTVGEGPPSRVTAVPVPAAPANLTATPGDRQVRLSWDDPRDDAVTGYQFQYFRPGVRRRGGSRCRW